MFNVLLFVIPGLVVYGIGAAISRRRQSAAASQSKTALTETPSTTVEDRLNELLELKDKKLITFCTLSLRRIRCGKSGCSKASLRSDRRAFGPPMKPTNSRISRTGSFA